VRTSALAALLAALALAAAGCGGDGAGGGGSATDALAETAENLGAIESGDLSLRLVVSSDGKDVGFELTGPFALAEEGKLPVAEVEYTQIAGSEEQAATFISTGEKAFVEIEGEVYELPDEQVEGLRGAGGGGDAGLGVLEIDDWLVEPELSGGDDVGGDSTDRITAGLDPVALANDLLALIAQLGGGSPGSLEGRSAEQLESAVESANIEVLTGKDDRILRRLVVEADLNAEVPEELRERLSGLPGATFELRLELQSPNEPVEVDEPTDAQPFPGR